MDLQWIFPMDFLWISALLTIQLPSKVMSLACHILYNESLPSVSLSDCAAFFFLVDTDTAFGEAHGCGD